MSERLNGTREAINNNWKKIVATVGGLALVGGAAFGAYKTYENITEKDDSQLVTGYLQAKGVNSFDIELNNEADEFRMRCPDPETDAFSDDYRLKIEKRLGQIESATVEVARVNSISYLGADGNEAHSVTEELDPIRYSLDTTEGQQAFEQFIAETPPCNQ